MGVVRKPSAYHTIQIWEIKAEINPAAHREDPDIFYARLITNFSCEMKHVQKIVQENAMYTSESETRSGARRPPAQPEAPPGPAARNASGITGFLFSVQAIYFFYLNAPGDPSANT